MKSEMANLRRSMACLADHSWVEEYQEQENNLVLVL